MTGARETVASEDGKARQEADQVGLLVLASVFLDVPLVVTCDLLPAHPHFGNKNRSTAESVGRSRGRQEDGGSADSGSTRLRRR